MLIKQAKTIRLRVIYSIIALIIGLSVFSIGLYTTIHGGGQSSQFDFASGFLLGGGGSMALVGVFLLLQILLLLRNPQKLQQFQIDENDERRQTIMEKTCKWTFVILALGITLASLIFAMVNFTVLITLICCLWTAAILFAIIYFFMSRRM